MGVPAADVGVKAAPAPAQQHTFDWTTTIEPHAARRRAILSKYGPQVRELYGVDRWTAVQVRCVVFLGGDGSRFFWRDGGAARVVSSLFRERVAAECARLPCVVRGRAHPRSVPADG